MPGASSFFVPIAGTIYDFPTTNGTEWNRQIPPPGVVPGPTGIADCNALEYMAPPTLRTAYSIYSLSIAWGAQLFDSADAPYVGNILAEVALLVNGDVVWVGTDAQPAILSSFASWYLADGVISADLVNPLRLNPRERLSLRLGGALSHPATVSAVNALYMIVGGKSLPSSLGFESIQSPINYQILDLPGNRSL